MIYKYTTMIYKYTTMIYKYDIQLYKYSVCTPPENEFILFWQTINPRTIERDTYECRLIRCTLCVFPFLCLTFHCYHLNRD